ncbi:MAG: VOC family protein [Rhizobiales bacterium]|nr:VOC family protein [Hyphomicrobiales bacterium]
MTEHGNFHWNEFVTRDPEGFKAFYAKTVGWTYEAQNQPTGECYWLIFANGRPVGGIFPTNQPGLEGIPDGWMPYLAVDDIDARVEKAVAAGAQLMKPIFEIPDVGRMAILMQPGGVGVGWITPAQGECGQSR